MLDVVERRKSAMTGMEEDENLRKLPEAQRQVCVIVIIVEIFLDENGR